MCVCGLQSCFCKLLLTCRLVTCNPSKESPKSVGWLSLQAAWRWNERLGGELGHSFLGCRQQACYIVDMVTDKMHVFLVLCNFSYFCNVVLWACVIHRQWNQYWQKDEAFWLKYHIYLYIETACWRAAVIENAAPEIKKHLQMVVTIIVSKVDRSFLL